MLRLLFAFSIKYNNIDTQADYTRIKHWAQLRWFNLENRYIIGRL